ncbi:hypothetical protein GCM10027079_12330 [Sediminivirga luteola]|uniref:Methyltransferase FkbM domain-containing protein n=1 Tax=Sediminivirga luteola TaxID=1774748 RepID=A0A8J2U0P0_9MICO|nr:hypothetical protein GCM10011333_30250 [Sediminivirga luteola]
MQVPDFRRSRRARRQSWYGAKKHVKTALSLPVLHPLMRLVAPRIPRITVRRLPAPRRLREVRGYAGGAGFVMVRPDRCEIAKELYWGHGHRPDPQDALALEVMTALAKQARTFLDIGAYTGVFTLAAAAANQHIRAHAYEIVPPVALALRANVERNRIADRTTVHHVGVGDPATTMRVPTSDDGSALPSFYSSDMAFDEGTTVGFVSLDSLTDEVRGPVAMKVDIEGGEASLFGHGQEFLARHRPDILCEVLPDADASALAALLAPHGLRYYVVGAQALEPRNALEPDAAYRDWFFSPRTPEELRKLGVPVAG